MTTDLREHLQATLGGAYALERELGGGGMSRVFVAQETSLGRRVVVKVVAPELGAGVNAERFRREIRLAAQLQHPHVVPLLSAGERDGLLYYTMPFVEGESLRATLARTGELPLAEAVRLLRDIADALAYAHRTGVVHRDLKPENVLLEEGHALVTDFGVAKALSAAADTHALTSVGVALGTPAYMAPEQAAADPTTDHRADLYAFGVVAYELLAGRTPFAHRAPHAQMAAHATEIPERLAAHRPSVGAELDGLVMRCLEKHPADRPQTADELLAVLDATRTPSGAAAAMRGSATPVSRRRLTMLASLAAAAVAAVAGGRALYERWAPSLDPRRVAVAVFENQTGDPALDPLGRMAADWLTQGLTQTQLLDVVPSSSTLYLGASTQGTGAPGAVGVGTGQSSTDPLRALALATGAATVVSGAYYRQGDSLRFQAQVTDANRGRLVRSIEPVSGLVVRPTEVVERLRQRVTAGLAALLDPKLGAMAWNTIEPPTYEAYSAFMLGLERFYRLEYPDAITHFARAALLDSTASQSTHNQALIWAAVAYVNHGRMAEADSVARVLAARRERLSTLDRHSLDWVLAILNGDTAGYLEGARRMHELTPGSDLSELIHGFGALRVGRATEAVAVLARIDERGPMGEWGSYWETLTGAHHVLGSHDRELAVARRGRARFPALPTLVYEARALAALGRIAAVNARLDECETLPRYGDATPGGAMERAALELRAHGHVAAAAVAADRATRWYRARSAEEQATESGRFGLARALYVAARWEEARTAFDRLAAEWPRNADYLGYRGVLAARRGDGAGAARIAADLAAMDQPYLRGRHTFWRSRIAAMLGERERAVVLLREALQQGEQYSAALHTIIEYESMVDHPSFRELLRPKE